MKTQARKVKIVTMRGVKIKLFELWALNKNAWCYCGHHSAPARTVNKSLAATVKTFWLA